MKTNRKEIKTAQSKVEFQAIGGNIDNIMIDDLFLSTRIKKALRLGKITQLSQLCDKSTKELSILRNMGRQSVSELKTVLLTYGIEIPDFPKDKV
jgi:DNA-directed RNA polymerase alpha subunit